MAGAGVAGDGGGHDADGAGAGDEDVFAEDGEGERGVDCIAEGIEDGGDRRASMPGACCQMLVMGRTMYSAKAPLRLTPTPLVWAQRWRRPARQLRQRPQTTWPSPRDDVAESEVVDVGAEVDDLADELVADGEAGRGWCAGPGVPLVDVEVGAADAGVEDADLDVVDARFRARGHPRARGRVLRLLFTSAFKWIPLLGPLPAQMRFYPGGTPMISGQVGRNQ